MDSARCHLGILILGAAHTPRETNDFVKTPLPAAIISNQSSVAAHRLCNELKAKKKTQQTKKHPRFFFCACACACVRVCVCNRLDFKVFLGSTGPRRREQASEEHTRVPVFGCGVADLSRVLNHTALTENSPSRSSPALEAAAAALAVACPRTISDRSPPDRACPVPPCSSQWPSPVAAL